MLSKKLCLFTILVALVVALGATAAQAGAKVEICHLPPGNPANFHTITVSENALTAHYGHGDLPGSCFANCETLCDDGDACSIDACDEATETCLADHPPVDCDDGNLCTTDSCDSADGCQYAPIACDDGDNCTVDTCNPYDGQCTVTPINCGSLGVCVAETGQCDFPCDGITCDPIDQCHEAGECVLPGECLDGAAVADGTACDDGDAGTTDDVCTAGVCAGTATAGCASGDRYEDQNDGTVLDCATGLVWLKDANCADLLNPATGNPPKWVPAEASVAALSDGTCGLTDGSAAGDWRQPTISEFCSAWTPISTPFNCPATAAPDSLIDTSVATQEKVATGHPFVGIVFTGYWSSTLSTNGGDVWAARVGNGFLVQAFFGNAATVWPVRSGQ